MKCQALDQNHNRQYFEITAGSDSVMLITPDGQKFYLVKSQVLEALSLPCSEHYHILLAEKGDTICGICHKDLRFIQVSPRIIRAPLD